MESSLNDLIFHSPVWIFCTSKSVIISAKGIAFLSPLREEAEKEVAYKA